MNDKKLIHKAKIASKKAYAPYSKYKVGAAIKCKNGKIFVGCNVENTSYGLTNCAERSAIFNAISEGEMEFEKLVVYVESGPVPTPCGACRQVIAEFCNDIKIIMISGKKVEKSSIDKLLPMKFKL